MDDAGETHVDFFNAVFAAKLTASALIAGRYAYAWSEQSFDPNTGIYTDANPGRFGTTTNSPAYELNNHLIPSSTYVTMRLRGVVGGAPVYEFMGVDPDSYVESDYLLDCMTNACLIPIAGSGGGTTYLLNVEHTVRDKATGAILNVYCVLNPNNCCPGSGSGSGGGTNCRDCGTGLNFPAGKTICATITVPPAYADCYGSTGDYSCLNGKSVSLVLGDYSSILGRADPCIFAGASAGFTCSGTPFGGSLGATWFLEGYAIRNPYSPCGWFLKFAIINNTSGVGSYTTNAPNELFLAGNLPLTYTFPDSASQGTGLCFAAGMEVVLSDGACSGGGGTAITPCCPAGLPNQLCVLLTNVAGLSGLGTGVQVTVTWNGTTWTGTTTACSSTISVTLSCAGTDCTGFMVSVSFTCAGGGILFSSGAPSSCDCTPSIIWTSITGSVGTASCCPAGTPPSVRIGVAVSTGPCGGGGGHIVPCCANPVPADLTATITDLGSCACLAGSYSLTWGGAGIGWVGTVTACGITVNIVLQCINPVWKLVIDCDAPNGGGTVQANADSAVCPPGLILTWNSLAVSAGPGGEVGCCTGNIKVVITS